MTDIKRVEEWSGLGRSVNIIDCEKCCEEVELPYFTNECDCGALYNPFGQSLKPVEEWDESYDDEEWLWSYDDEY